MLNISVNFVGIFVDRRRTALVPPSPNYVHREAEDHIHPAFPPRPFPSPLSPFSALILPANTMPTCRRKRVVLTEPSPALLEAFKKDPSRDVFYLERTGELFETYESVPQSILTPSFYSQYPSKPSERPVDTQQGCHFTDKSSSSARSLAKVV